MKKTIILLLTIVILFLCICSCKKTNDYKPYTVYEVASEEYLSSAQHSSEIIFDWGYSEKFKLIKSKTVTVGNTKCDVKYTETETGYLYKNDVDYYKGTNDEGYDVEIGINTKTGDIDRYFRFSKRGEDFSGLTVKDRDTCLKIATDYLSSYVDDVENYKITFERFDNGRDTPSDYFFIFSRYIEEMKTFDCARIAVTVYGVVREHRFDCLGELKDAKVPDQTTLDELDVKVTEKLDEIYSSIKDTHTVEYGERDVSLVKLSDGSYALEYYIDVTLLESDDFGYNESTHLIIYLD